MRLLIFLPAILVPACASSIPAFCMMYSAYKLNKQVTIYSLDILLFQFGVWGSVSKESAHNVEDPGSTPGPGRCPWRRKWQPTPVFLPEEFYGWRSLVGYSPWGHKESDMTETLTHSSIWKKSIGPCPVLTVFS